jgi:DNA-directed RNA polymerase subunit RPC12/RpoP
MGKRHGTCMRCGKYFNDGDHPYICNDCLQIEPRGKRYKCMKCGKIYDDKYIPTFGNGDGCCTIGSLIELDS